MTQNRIFRLLAEKWIAESITPFFRHLSMSACIKIWLNSLWHVTKAHIHAPGGQKIAAEFNKMTGGVSPLSLKVRKVVYAKAYQTRPIGRNQYPFPAQLGPSNEYRSDNRTLYNDIKTKGIPATTLWSGD